MQLSCGLSSHFSPCPITPQWRENQLYSRKVSLLAQISNFKDLYLQNCIRWEVSPMCGLSSFIWIWLSHPWIISWIWSYMTLPLYGVSGNANMVKQYNTKFSSIKFYNFRAWKISFFFLTKDAGWQSYEILKSWINPPLTI